MGSGSGTAGRKNFGSHRDKHHLEGAAIHLKISAITKKENNDFNSSNIRSIVIYSIREKIYKKSLYYKEGF